MTRISTPINSVYTSIPISRFIPPSASPLVSILLFSKSVSLCKYPFSSFYTYRLIYDVCFSLSGFLHPVGQSQVRSRIPLLPLPPTQPVWASLLGSRAGLAALFCSTVTPALLSPCCPVTPAGSGLSYGWSPPAPGSGPARGGMRVGVGGPGSSSGRPDVRSGPGCARCSVTASPTRGRGPRWGQIRKSTGGHRPEKVQGGAPRCCPGGRVPAPGAEACGGERRGPGVGRRRVAASGAVPFDPSLTPTGSRGLSVAEGSLGLTARPVKGGQSVPGPQRGPGDL